MAIRGAHAVSLAEGNTAGGGMRESPAGPTRSENQGMYGTSMRENRESPCPPGLRCVPELPRFVWHVTVRAELHYR